MSTASKNSDNVKTISQAQRIGNRAHHYHQYRHQHVVYILMIWHHTCTHHTWVAQWIDSALFSTSSNVVLPTYIQKECSLSTSTYQLLHSSKGSTKSGGVIDTQTHVPPGRNTRARLHAMRGSNQSKPSEHAIASRVPLSTAASNVSSWNARLHASITNHCTSGLSADFGRPCSMHVSEKSMLVMLRHPRSYILRWGIIYA